MTEPSAPHAAPAQVPSAAKLCFSLALVVVVGTYVAAQVDFWRRHTPGIAPGTYLRPQLLQIWVPGLVLSVGLVLVGVLARRQKRITEELPSPTNNE